ncbi:MAG: hypothetical protein MUC37_13230 [Hyphomicrobium sp.]|jgi:hypothetical protein|nr:hypothetical protein [Hyphomicrobium sp.]
MPSKPPTFGQRNAPRQPTIIRRVEPRHPVPAETRAEAPGPQVPATAAVFEENPSQPAAPPVMAMPPQPEPNARWAKRSPARLGGQICHSSLSTPLACTVRDTSSTGARIEVVTQRGGNISRDRVPDQFTLFMPAERLEVDCEVMWRQGQQAGVRYTSPTRRLPRQEPVKISAAPKKPHTSLISLLINPS